MKKPAVCFYRLSILLFCCLLLVTGSGCSGGAKEAFNQSENETVTTDEKLDLYATSAVLMDGVSGRLLYGKNETTFMANASTTKILTCIVTLENADLNMTITASKYASSMPKVHLGMTSGEQFYLKDLMYSMMLESHNDSAVAIAEGVAGSVEAFAKLMNEKAEEIGCENSFFITPNGLDAVDSNNPKQTHGTTALDLAKIMAYCVNESPKREEFLAITQTTSYSFSDLSGQRNFSCTNHNQLLQMYTTAISGKTGFTANAGYCYVGALKDGDRLYIVALLACGWPNNKSYKWSDCRKLLSYGMNNYTYQSFAAEKLQPSSLQRRCVEYAQGAQIGEDVYASYELSWKKQVPEGILLKAGETIDTEIDLKDHLSAPIDAGTKVGSVTYKVNGQIYGIENVLIKEEIHAIDFSWCFRQILNLFF